MGTGAERRFSQCPMSLRVCTIAVLAAVLAVPAASGQTTPADGRYIRDWLLAGPFTERHLWLLQVAGGWAPDGSRRKKVLPPCR